MPILWRRSWTALLVLLGGWLLLQPRGHAPVPYRQILTRSRQAMAQATRILATLPVPSNPGQGRLATSRLLRVEGNLRRTRSALTQSGLAFMPQGQAVYQAVGQTLQWARSARSASGGLERILQSASAFDRSPSAAMASAALRSLGPLPQGTGPLIQTERVAASDWSHLLHLYEWTSHHPSPAVRSQLQQALGRFTGDLQRLSALWRSPGRW